jgi:hypothetical protein
MIELDVLFRSDGTGPSGTAGPVDPGELLGDDGPEEDGDGEGEAEVTATVSAAAGGVHVSLVATAAVAVSLTELTELALAATGIWA